MSLAKAKPSFNHIMSRSTSRLAPDVNRILFVKHLPFKITSEEMYDIFGKYGSIRQIRMGTTKDTRGTAYVVFDDIYDAKSAVEGLAGFCIKDQYIVVLYHKADHAKQKKAMDIEKKKQSIADLKKKLGE